MQGHSGHFQVQMPHIFALLSHYGYAILFPLAIVEGPIITVIAGLFVKSGIFTFYGVYAIAVAGDILGDGLAYSVGRFGGPVVLKKFGKFFGVTEEKTTKARERFTRHHNKTILFSKIIHGVGVAGLITAGNLKIPYPRFFFVCLCVSLVQSVVFLSIGMFFGRVYEILNSGLNIFSEGTIVVGIIVALVLIFRHRIKNKAKIV